MNEIWKEIEGYNGDYEVSNHGRVKSKLYFNGTSERILTQQISHNRYYRVTLRKDGKSKVFFAHRLVANAFVPNVDNKPFVNHKDSNRVNNHYLNLEWVTSSENNKHAVMYGKMDGSYNSGTKSNLTKYSEDVITSVRKDLKQKLNSDEIALKYGMSVSNVNHIKYGTSWKHLK